MATPATTRRKSLLVTEALDIIDQDQSGDLGEDEVKTLLAAMGLKGKDVENVMKAVFEEAASTTHNNVTDAILMWTDVGEGDLETMLGRVVLFQKAFRKIDVDGNQKLNLNEIIWMMESLNIEKKLAADLMAFLDDDDSGDVTWVEFVKGMSSDQFQVLFPRITLEALVAIPSSLRRHKIVSAEEEAEAIKDLPSIEKSLYWMISLFYGRSSPSHGNDVEDEEDDEIPPKSNNTGVQSAGLPGLERFFASLSSNDLDLPKDEEADSAFSSTSSSDSDGTTTSASEDAELPGMMGQEESPPVVIVRKQAKDAQKVQPAKVRSGKDMVIVRNVDKLPELRRWEDRMPPKVVVRKYAKDAEKVQPAKVRMSKNLVITRKVAKNPDLALYASQVSLPRLSDVRSPDKKNFPTLQLPRGSLGSQTPKSILKGADSRKSSVEKPPSEKAPLPEKRVSLESAPRMGRRGSVMGAAMTSMLQGFQGLAGKRPAPAKTKTITLEDAVTSMRSMEVKGKSKAHVLTEEKRKAMWRVAHAAVGAGILAGIGAAFFAQALNDFTSTLVDEEQDFIAWNVLAGTFSLIWSLAEMLVCVVAALVAAVKMTRICGIMLVPMDKERAMLAGSLARAALELGHPKVRTFGIDPHKRASKFLLLLYAVIYMGSRGVTKFLIKLIVKKVAPRTLLKFAEMAPLVIEILINVLFNFVTVRYAMNEVIICALGPSATVEVTSQLVKAHRKSRDVDEPLSDRLKLLALRAVGVSITYKMQLHPNSRCLLDHIVELFVDEGFVRRAKAKDERLNEFKMKAKSKASAGVGGSNLFRCCGSKAPEVQNEKPAETYHEELAELGLDDEDAFFEALGGLNDRDSLFACSMLFLALMLDGRIGSNDWKFIQRAARSVRPPLDAKWPSAVHLMSIFVSGRQMTAELFHDIFQSSKEGEASAATCCDVFSGAMRSLTQYTNCC